MKRLISLLLALLLSHALFSAARAQEPAAALDWLTVDLWPDYDRPQVLVLLTGALPADAPRPATVTIPLPSGATVNAVARISAENQMIDDVEYTTEGDTLSLVTPDTRFRVEYYMPYTGDDLQREFTFRWTSDMRIGEMDVSVQQPRAATALTVEPPADSVIEGSDGLQYHNLPLRELPAGDPYVVQAQYTMQSDTLTQPAGSVPAEGAGSGSAPSGSNAAQPGGSAAQPGSNSAQAGGGFTFSWPIVLAAAGGLLIGLALAWQLLVARSGSRSKGRATPRKPQPSRKPESSGDAPAARYCHNCGQQAQPGDRFCRECGTPLKRA